MSSRRIYNNLNHCTPQSARTQSFHNYNKWIRSRCAWTFIHLLHSRINQTTNIMGIEEQTNSQIALFRIQNITILCFFPDLDIPRNLQTTTGSKQQANQSQIGRHFFGNLSITCSALVEEVQLTWLPHPRAVASLFLSLLDVRASFAQFLCEGISMTPLKHIILHVLFEFIASRSGAWATSVPPKQAWNRQMMQYLVTQSWTICLWASRETNHGPTTSLKHGKNLLRLQYRRYHHTFENVLSRRHLFATRGGNDLPNLCVWRRERTGTVRHIGSVMPAMAHQVGAHLQMPWGLWLCAAGLPKDPSSESGKRAAVMAEQFAQLDQHVSQWDCFHSIHLGQLETESTQTVSSPHHTISIWICLMFKIMMMTRHSGLAQQQKASLKRMHTQQVQTETKGWSWEHKCQDKCFHSVKEYLLPNLRVRSRIKERPGPHNFLDRWKRSPSKTKTTKGNKQNILTDLNSSNQTREYLRCTAPRNVMWTQLYDTNCAVSQKPSSHSTCPVREGRGGTVSIAPLQAKELQLTRKNPLGTFPNRRKSKNLPTVSSHPVLEKPCRPFHPSGKCGISCYALLNFPIMTNFV